MKFKAISLPAGLVFAAVFTAVAAAAPAGQVAHGKTLATSMGCRNCHGETLTGQLVVDDPTIATLFSSNLTRSVPTYSDKSLERVIRTGVRPDGSHLWLMAAAPYAVLTPSDLRDLIAYLRSVAPSGAPHPRLVARQRFLKAAMACRVQPESLTLARDLANPPADFGPEFARGRYLVRTTCAGCHKADLEGAKDAQPGDPPSLRTAAAYDRDQFLTLLRTAKAPGGRNVEGMAEAVRERFTVLRDSEIDAIHRYLKAFVERAPGER